MELRIENGRGKWRTVKSEHDKFYKALQDAQDAAVTLNRNNNAFHVQDMFFPVAAYGVNKTRVFITNTRGGYVYAVDRPVDPAYAAWVSLDTLSPAGEKPKREVSPETRERLAKNLEKARAARGKK